MTTEPDPKAVRKIARRSLTNDIHRLMPGWFAQGTGPLIHSEAGPGGLSVEDFTAWHEAVVKRISTARITVSWPDGESQDLPERPRLFTDIDRDTNPYLRVRAFINAAREKPDTNGQGLAGVIDGDNVMHVLTEDDVESLLEDQGEMQEEIDRLIGELVKAQDEQDADVRPLVRLLDLIDCDPESNYAAAITAVRDRYADRIDVLDARDAAAGGVQPNGDPIWEEQ